MAQRFSQNGWPAHATTVHFTRFTAAGQKWWAANDDVAVVFTEFITRFDREVEEITQNTLDDWSYANRLVRGSSSVVSNHGSATAIDLNALKHPRGVHNTFSAAKRTTMHRLRDAITDNSGRPVLRLGMDYTTTVDDMHVEIDANAARVKQAANKIRARQEPTEEEDDGMANITPAEFLKLLNDTQVKLTESAARHMNTAAQPHKEGDLVSLNYLFQWGGPGEFRQLALLQALQAQVGALTGTVAALAGAIKAGGSLTAAQATAAAQEGAEAALAKLGDALTDTDN
jgi:hypothetical protein